MANANIIKYVNDQILVFAKLSLDRGSSSRKAEVLYRETVDKNTGKPCFKRIYFSKQK